MRLAAFLSTAFGLLEPDHRRELRPGDRIEPFELQPNWHQIALAF
jgi:hypothetical protein